MHPDDREAISTARVTRRHVVGTGVKLAYSAPVLAATFQLTASGGLAVGNCLCKPAGFVLDLTPPLDQDSNPLGFVPACCSCAHCTFLGAVNPVYVADSNQCFDNGQSLADRCYPLCAEVCDDVSV